MEKTTEVPLIRCEKCESVYNLTVITSGIKIKSLFLDCKNCDQQINIIDKTADAYIEQKKKLQPLINRLTQLIIEAKRHIPKNKDDLSEAIQDPKHPFTAAVISALVLLLMELSGFGIFIVMSWILGNLILNPIGWVLIPIVVAITFTHKKSLKNKIMVEFGKLIKDLEEMFNNNEITKNEV